MGAGLCLSVYILTISCCALRLSAVVRSIIRALILVSLYVQWDCRLWVGSTLCSARVLQPSWWRRGRCTRWSTLSTPWPCNTLNTPLLLLLLPPSYLRSLPPHLFRCEFWCWCKHKYLLSWIPQMFFQDPPYMLIGLLLSFLHDKSLSGFLSRVPLAEYSTSIKFLDRKKEMNKKSGRVPLRHILPVKKS